MELQVRGQVCLTGGKAGQATVIRVLQSESPVRLTLPASPEVSIQSSAIRYNTEAQQLVATGTLTFRLPKGVTAEVRGGKAVSSTLRKGEPIALTVTAEEG